MKPLHDVDVVVLAGGLGTRLGSLAAGRPKVMAPVAGRPLLDHLLDSLRRQGARRVVLSLGHLHEVVERHVAGRAPAGLEVLASVERRPLGTGGGLRAAWRLLRSKDVLVLNGDSLVRADLGRFLAFHRRRKARVSILLSRVDDVSRFGRVRSDGRGRVRGFLEKDGAGPRAGYVSAGVYLFRREALRSIPPRREVSLERDVFPRLVGRSFYALRGRHPFIDIGTPSAYRRADAFVRAGRS